VADLDNVADIKEGLRLDYDDSPFDGADEIAILDFPKPTDLDVVHRAGLEFDGSFDEPYPFTRNGFTGTTKGKAIPEYHIGIDVEIGIPEGTILYRLGPDGVKDSKTFVNREWIDS
jgi:hypothetical protein